MSMRVLSMMIFFGFIGVLNDISHSWMQRRMAKKSNYDCSKCKAWDCPYRTCKEKVCRIG